MADDILEHAKAVSTAGPPCVRSKIGSRGQYTTLTMPPVTDLGRQPAVRRCASGRSL